MPDLMRLLDQGEWWVTRDLRRVRIADMAPEHAGNAFRVLLRHPLIGWLRFLWEGVHIPHASGVEGDMAYDAILQEQRAYMEDCERRTDEEWLRTTPLGAALLERSKVAA